MQGRTLNGLFEVSTEVVKGVVCEWQVSGDLQMWTPVRTNTAAVSGPLLLREAVSGPIDQRFYRVQYR